MEMFVKEMLMWKFQQRHLWQKYTKDSISTDYTPGVIAICKKTGCCIITVDNADVQTSLC